MPGTEEEVKTEETVEELPEETVEETTTEETAPEGSDDDKPVSRAELRRLEGELRKQEMVNVGLRGMIAGRETARSEKETPKEDEDSDLTEDWTEEEMQGLKTNAPQILRERERRLVKRMRAETTTRVERAATTAAQRESKTNDKMRAVQTETFTDFPQLKTGSPDYNQEFVDAANAEYQRRVNERGYALPEDFYDAPARVARKMGIGLNGSRGKVTTKVRQVVNDPVVKGSRGGGSGKPETDPFAGLSKETREAAEFACRELKMSPKDWRRSYDAAQAEQGE